jgi:hypothetical protein
MSKTLVFLFFIYIWLNFDTLIKNAFRFHFLGQTSDGHALHAYGTVMFDTIIWYVYYYIYKKYHRYERKNRYQYIVKAR